MMRFVDALRGGKLAAAGLTTTGECRRPITLG